MVSVNKKDSIYFQLLKLLTFSAIIAVTFFVLMNRNSDDFIARYYEESDYAEKRDERYVDKFQAFIDANEISSKDTAKLKAWVKEQKVITLRVYVDDKKIFIQSIRIRICGMKILNQMNMTGRHTIL